MTRISIVLLNFVLNAGWQIVVIVAVAALGSNLLKSASANYRYALWLATLGLSLGLPLWSVTNISSGVRSEGVVNAESASTNFGVAKQASAAVDEDANSTSFERLLARRRPVVVSVTPQNLMILSAVYAVFLLLRIIRLARLWRRKERARRTASESGITAPIMEIARRCRAAFGLGPVTVVCSAEAVVPVTLGAWNPVIVLPEHFCAEMDEDTLLSVIGHEMAHVSRRDFAINFLCELIWLPISFHPLTYLIKRQAQRSRELACDELVTRRLLTPQAYARSLVRVANATVQTRSEALTLSIFDGNILEERIMKLTQKHQSLGRRIGRAAVVTAFSALVVVGLAISTLSFDLQAFASSPATNPFATDPVVVPVATSQPILASRNLLHQSNREQATGSETAQARAQAACASAQDRDVEAIPTLVAMLGDDTKAELIRCWANSRWSPALETFKHSSPGEQAALALASMGSPAFGPLAEQLGNSNSVVRRNAAWAIGELTNMVPGQRAGAVPQLVLLLGDADVWVRMAAARALGELTDDRAGERLIVALSDSEWKVRELAAWALSEMKDKRAVKALCGVLLTDLQVEVRRTAAEALGEIRSAEALSSLKQALNDPETRVRSKAGWAISEIEDSDGSGV